MNENDLFGGFTAFDLPEVPEGAIEVRYGLSVEAVQVVGEVQAAPEDGISVTELARRLAVQFNMPETGLRVFVDGTEVPFNEETKVPVEARNVEFRQPGSEKGAEPILLPMDWEEVFTVTVVAVDTEEAFVTRAEALGTVKVEGIVAEFFDPAIFRPAGDQTVFFYNRGRWHFWKQWFEVVHSTKTARFVSRATMQISGQPQTCDFVDQQDGAIGLVVNGEEVGLYDNLLINPDDEITIFVAGETTRRLLPEVVESLSYKALQAVARTLGLPAKGKRSELLERLAG